MLSWINMILPHHNIQGVSLSPACACHVQFISCQCLILQLIIHYSAPNDLPHLVLESWWRHQYTWQLFTSGSIHFCLPTLGGHHQALMRRAGWCRQAWHQSQQASQARPQQSLLQTLGHLAFYNCNGGTHRFNSPLLYYRPRIVMQSLQAWTLFYFTSLTSMPGELGQLAYYHSKGAAEKGLKILDCG